MTPLALKAMRNARAAGDSASYDVLCQFQWFDVSPIEPMINVAIDSNRSIEALAGRPMPPFSERCHLPARMSWIEALRPNGRCAWVCVEKPCGSVAVRLVTGARTYPAVIIRAGDVGFRIERGDWGKVEPAAAGAAVAAEVEAILAVVNQPGLVQASHVPCHRSERREAQRRGHAVGDEGLWTIYNIRPGRHGRAYGGHSDEPTRPLHHVRKHYKPRASQHLGRPVWIDDYWRGDPSLGIIHKTYVLQPPKFAAQANGARQAA